jgi:hypothetical protein
MGTAGLVAWLAVALQAPCPAGPHGPDGSDGDRDGLSDLCELEVARAFAPVLVVSPAACNFDPASARLEGGYLFAVQPIPGGIRAAYLPAYLQDCGWDGPKCLLRLRGGCDPHAGDSELIVVDLTAEEATGGWRVERVFLSAHCFGRGEDCRWHAADALEWHDRAPVVWVAEGKNANYVSRSACDSGHWRFDTCDRNDRSVRFPVVSSAQNIGSMSDPFPAHTDDPSCVTTSELTDLPASDRAECIWTDSIFLGWQEGPDDGSTGYRRYLIEVVGLGASP